jgi:hypothetical protein
VLSLLVPVTQTAPVLAPSVSTETAWPQQSIALKWDVAHGHPAQDNTTVHFTTDGKMFYVRFDAEQHTPVIATQHGDDLITGGSNANGGISWSNDDAVWVDLWPTGPGGFEYQFESNPAGAHNEASTENAAFAPDWQSEGNIHGNGYTVTMAIPLSVIHGAKAGTWRMQFVRYERASGELDVWSYDTSQTQPDDSARAGSVSVPLVAKAPIPKPRAAIYGLGQVATESAGGSTSRMGADFSIPVTPTAAFFGTLHPDYSNVELDQQSISPTVYQRTYSEVRPFFTQAASYYNNFNCNVCNGFRTTLYTPGIPTPRDGYAFEGKDGLFGLAAYDAIGDQRTDIGSALNYTSPDTHWQFAAQHAAANLSGLVDDANQVGLNWYNGKHLSAYVNYATDRGTNVLDASQGNWVDAGGGWGDQHFALYGSVRKVGSYFNPVDGFDSHPGIAGYGAYMARIWTFAPQDVLQSAGVSVFLDRYQGVQYGEAQSDNQVLLDLLFKNTFDVQLQSGSNYWRFDQTLTPISQSGGFSITYHSGMQNNVGNFPAHGASAYPTQVQYYTGRYGLGRLDTWFRSSVLKMGERGSVTLTLDNTSQWYTVTPNNIQWFEGVAYAYQITHNSSLAIGLRRVVGYPPQPNGGGNCEGECSNVSVAYHLRWKNYELYAAYGDPNTLITVPQAIFKLIFYAGGQKGT